MLTNQTFSDHLIALGKKEPAFAQALQETGPLQLRTSETGDPALLRIIIGQQISTIVAEKVIARLKDSELFELSELRKLTIEELRQFGLSRQKATYIHALADAKLEHDHLGQQSSEYIIKTLTEIKGIGRWTAEIYLMFALRRPDVIPCGDLALQESYRILFNHPSRPLEAELRQLAQSWAPYRSAASQLLWAYYHVVKGRAGV